MTAPGFRGTQELAYGKTGQVVRCWPEVNGVVGAPGSTTYAVYEPGKGPPEDTALVSGTATVNNTTHEITVTLNLSDTDTWKLNEGYTLHLAWSGAQAPRVVQFDVVRQPLHAFCPLRADDLKHAHAGVTGALARLGLTDAEVADIIIWPAWMDVLDHVRASGADRGGRPALTTGAEALRDLALQAGKRRLFEYLHREQGDVWEGLADRAAVDFDAAKARTVLLYRAGDGNSGAPSRGWQTPRLWR